MKKFNYTYWITSIEDGKNYIGVRTTNVDPIKDLGIKYFSSSKELSRKFKDNKNKFEFKVLEIFETRKEAILKEIELHCLYRVSTNKRFYNKSIQTSIGFDYSGCKHSEDTKKKISLGLKKTLKSRTEEEKIKLNEKLKKAASERESKKSDKRKEEIINKQKRTLSNKPDSFWKERYIKRKLTLDSMSNERKTELSMIKSKNAKQQYLNKTESEKNHFSDLCTKRNRDRVHNNTKWGMGKIITKCDLNNNFISSGTIDMFMDEGFVPNRIYHSNHTGIPHKNFLWKIN